MPIFITLLVPKAKGKEAIDEIKKVVPPEGVTIIGKYFTLGRFDGVIIYEAPDEKTAMKFAMDIGYTTGWTVETLAAVPIEEI